MPTVSHVHEPPHGLTPVRRLLRLLDEERGEVGLVYLYAAFAGLLALALPLGVQAIIGLVAGGLLLQPVVLLIAFVVLGTAASGALMVLQQAAVERLQQRVFARLALDWSARIPRVRLDVPGNLPETVNRFFEVVIIQKSLAKLLTEAVAALLAILFGLVLLTIYHPALSGAGLLLLVALAAALWMTGRDGLRTSLAESAAKYRVAHWLQELARRRMTFRLAGDVPVPVTRVDAEVADYLRARQAHFRVIVRQSVAAVAFKVVITGALLVIGAMLVIDRRITLGQFVASELVVVTVLMGVEKLITCLTTTYDLLTSLDKAAHVGELPLAADHRGAEALAGAPAAATAGSAMVARGLSFVRPSGRRILHDVGFAARPGERVAIIGSEGAGATTLLALLAGLHEGWEGVLTLDGVSMRDLDVAELRRRIALVESSPGVFDGTLLENVTVGRAWVEAADVREALQVAGLADYIAELPDGLRTRVGEAAALPTHLARKVALARALAGRPSLLLLDEVFHHLEPMFKRELLTRLLARDAGWTIIAASHDPLFLASCDRIVMLEDGRVVRQGRFEDLLADPAFAGLLRAQGAAASTSLPQVAASRT